MLGNDLLEAARHQSQSIVPRHVLAIDPRRQQPPLQPHGFGQRAAFGTQPPPVGRMVGVALDGQAGGGSGRQNPTAHTAIGAGRAYRHAAT